MHKLQIIFLGLLLLIGLSLGQSVQIANEGDSQDPPVISVTLDVEPDFVETQFVKIDDDSMPDTPMPEPVMTNDGQVETITVAMDAQVANNQDSTQDPPVISVTLDVEPAEDAAKDAKKAKPAMGWDNVDLYVIFSYYVENPYETAPEEPSSANAKFVQVDQDPPVISVTLDEEQKDGQAQKGVTSSSFTFYTSEQGGYRSSFLGNPLNEKPFAEQQAGFVPVLEESMSNFFFPPSSAPRVTASFGAIAFFCVLIFPVLL